MKKRKLKFKVKVVFLIVFIIVFLFSTLKLLFFFKDNNQSKKSNKKLNEEVIDIKLKDDEEIIKVDFKKLLSINNETVGWIRFNNDKVNNPIVHTSNNDYYLNHSFEKKKNQAGTIFMDYRNTSFNDKNVVLFGHSMPNSTMFGSISDVFKKDFFNDEKNKYIQIITSSDETFTYQIFSYYISEKEEYYISTAFNDDESFQKFIDTIRKRSYREFNLEVLNTDNILTLSTCYGTGNTTKRQVVHAKRIY